MENKGKSKPLSEVKLNKKMDKSDYKNELSSLEDRLTYLQQKVRNANLPIVIVFEGWSASGKGTQIARLVNPLDPRYFHVHTTGRVTEDSLMRPFLWRFWSYLPRRGEIAILDKSWHRLNMPGHSDEWGLTSKESHGFYYDVNAFERQLTDDGLLLIKLFFHIGKKEQASRFKKLESDPTTLWRINNQDWTQNKNYDENLHFFEKLLKMTSTEQNPWHIIESECRRHATVKMMQTIITAIETKLEEIKNPKQLPTQDRANIIIPKVLENASVDENISNERYKEQLIHYQKKMHALGDKMYMKRRSAVIVYEGWDAAGKGGNIKRLTSESDPRCYAVIPISAPTRTELSRHYLWRFMIHMPKDGHMTVFDRSWYGRVLVERVENLTPQHIWERGYQEINEMEQHLANHGTTILKFWLHVDQDEQLARFKNRQDDPLKHHKITDDDWRNREKWAQYEAAMDEVLARTHTPHAPWIIVESNQKKYSRIKVLQTVTEALEEAMR